MTATQSYFICFTVRSGSTLLCQLLTDTGLAGTPKEHLYHDIRPDNPQGESIPDYKAFLSNILTEDTTPNGVFGTKVGGGVWHDFIRRLRTIDNIMNKPLDEALNQLFPNLHYLWLTRRNKVRQAVSHWMAIQSGRWHSPNHASNPQPEYNFDAIDHLVQELVIREAVWGDYFATHHITPHVVVYEDFIQDKQQTIHNILDYLDIDRSESFTINAPTYQRLANDLSETWVQRYRAEKQQDWWATFWQ